MVVGLVVGTAEVPEPLPGILKDYTKAAIRTQPKDLLLWSLVYFRALNEGTRPPVKDYLEFPLPHTPSGLSPGLLRLLHLQLVDKGSVSLSDVSDLCQALGIAESLVKDAWDSCPPDPDNEDLRLWPHLMVNMASKSTMRIADAVTLAMAAITDEPLTRRANVEDVVAIYDLADTSEDEGDKEIHNETIDYLQDVASFQDGYIIPGDILRPSCPINK